MNFDYYTSMSMQLAVDMVNTLSVVNDVDLLVHEDDLRKFLVDHNDILKLTSNEIISDVNERKAVNNMYHEMIEAWHIHRNDVDKVRALREPLRTVFEKAASDEKGAAAILNEQLQISHVIPRISWQHGPLHLHFESAEEGCSQWLAATAVMGLTVMLCEYGGSRFGICASSSCRNVFLDTSKNKRKRYCSEACAHRESVAAFRARRRSNKLNKS